VIGNIAFFILGLSLNVQVEDFDDTWFYITLEANVESHSVSVLDVYIDVVGVTADDIETTLTGHIVFFNIANIFIFYLPQFSLSHAVFIMFNDKALIMV